MVRNKAYYKIVGLILVLLILVTVRICTGNSPEVAETYAFSDKMPIIQGNSLLPMSPVYLPYVEALATEIIECESEGKHEEVWGDAGEYGIAQFMKDTFYWMAELSELQNPDWKDKSQQEYLLRWAIINDIAEQHWTCFPK